MVESQCGPVDLLLRGGLVRTLDAAGTTGSALAVRDGDVVAVGSDDDLAPLAGARTRVVDLDGRAVLPGICEPHVHAMWLGARWPALFFEGPGDAPSGRLLHTEAERRAALRRAWSLLAGLGITSYTEPGIGPGEDDGETGCFGQAVLDTYVDLAGTPEQTARVTLLRLFGLIDGPSALDAVLAGIARPVPRTDPRWLAVTGVKLFADGIPPAGTAWTSAHYPVPSGRLLTGTGPQAERAAALTAMIRAVHDAGLQVAVHATGDLAFDAVAQALAGRRPTGRHHYVVHGDLTTPELAARLAALGIGVDVQPLIAEATSAGLPPAVTADCWRLDTLLGHDVLTTLSSDAPVASPDWRRTIVAAAHLLADRGVAVTPAVVTTLLRAVTVAPARRDGALAWRGTLEPGKVADLVVLDADPLAVDVDAIASVGIDTTIVGGRVAYAASSSVPVG